MRTLVLGGAGMLGHKVVQRLLCRISDTWWTLTSARSDASLEPVPELRGEHGVERVDASRLESITHLVRELRPDVVVNCIGIIKQRAQSADLPMSITLNSFVPQLVAMTLREWNGRLVQVSTDCVFSGARGGYAESDEPDATDTYGLTKALGEVRLDNVVTLRTSMIGRELKHHQSLLDWFLAQRGQRIRGFRHAIWSGVTAQHLAAVIESVIREHPRLHGVYHVAGQPVSKYDLLLQLRDAYQLEVQIDPDDTFRCDRSLVGAHFERATGYRCPPLASMIRDLVCDPTPYAPLS